MQVEHAFVDQKDFNFHYIHKNAHLGTNLHQFPYELIHQADIKMCLYFFLVTVEKSGMVDDSIRHVTTNAPIHTILLVVNKLLQLCQSHQ